MADQDVLRFRQQAGDQINMALTVEVVEYRFRFDEKAKVKTAPLQ
jgi:hypothetical protein